MKSTLENFKQKAGSPLYGCILIAWVAFNWKPIAIFFLSNEDIYLKIRAISAYYSTDRQFWNPVYYGLLAAILFPVLNGIYNFIDVFTSTLIHTKNHLVQIAVTWTKNKKELWGFKLENSRRLNQATLEWDVVELERKSSQSRLEKELADANLETLEAAQKAIDELTKENDRLKLERDDLASHPLEILGTVTEDKILSYLNERRQMNKNDPNYPRANFSNLSDKFN